VNGLAGCTYELVECVRAGTPTKVAV